MCATHEDASTACENGPGATIVRGRRVRLGRDHASMGIRATPTRGCFRRPGRPRVRRDFFEPEKRYCRMGTTATLTTTVHKGGCSMAHWRHAAHACSERITHEEP